MFQLKNLNTGLIEQNLSISEPVIFDGVKLHVQDEFGLALVEVVDKNAQIRIENDFISDVAQLKVGQKLSVAEKSYAVYKTDVVYIRDNFGVASFERLSQIDAMFSEVFKSFTINSPTPQSYRRGFDFSHLKSKRFVVALSSSVASACLIWGLASYSSSTQPKTIQTQTLKHVDEKVITQAQPLEGGSVDVPQPSQQHQSEPISAKPKTDSNVITKEVVEKNASELTSLLEQAVLEAGYDTARAITKLKVLRSKTKSNSALRQKIDQELQRLR